MTKNQEQATEEGGGLLRDKVCIDSDDLAVFRWLDKQISNKRAITACLLVLQGSAYSGAPLGANQAAK